MTGQTEPAASPAAAPRRPWESRVLPPPFDHAERTERYSRVRRLMRDEGLRALIVAPTGDDIEACSYLTGPVETLYFPLVCLPLEGEPLAYAPPDVSAAFPAVFLFNMEKVGGRPWIGRWRFGADGLEELAGDLRRAELDHGRVGAVNFAGTSAGDFFAQTLPGLELVPMDAAFARLRASLTPQIEQVVQAASACVEDGTAALLEGLGSGTTHAEIARAVREAVLKAGAAAPDVILGLPNGLPSRYRPIRFRDTVHLGPAFDAGWRQRGLPPPVIRTGDLVTTEIQAWIGVVEARAQVTAHIGEPPAHRRRLFDAAEAAYRAGVSAVRPGRPLTEVISAMADALPAGAAFLESPVLALNPEWREDRHEPATITPGMHLHVRPSVGVRGAYTTIGGGVLAGPSGARELNPLASRVHII